MFTNCLIYSACVLNIAGSKDKWHGWDLASARGVHWFSRAENVHGRLRGVGRRFVLFSMVAAAATVVVVYPLSFSCSPGGLLCFLSL